MKKCLGLVLGLAGAGLLCAQELPRFSFSIGGGFTRPVGNTSRNLDSGWNVRGGVGYNFTDRFGANLNLGFDSMGINSDVLNSVGAPGGDVHIFSATLDPIVHRPCGRVPDRRRRAFSLEPGVYAAHRLRSSRLQPIFRALSSRRPNHPGSRFVLSE